MDIVYYIKKDLETFSAHDLKTMYQYFDISNTHHKNDNLWLLAIKINDNISMYTKAQMFSSEGMESNREIIYQDPKFTLVSVGLRNYEVIGANGKRYKIYFNYNQYPYDTPWEFILNDFPELLNFDIITEIALIHAIDIGDGRLFNKVLAYVSDLEYYHHYYTPLIFAVMRENVEFVKKLIDAGANVNAKTKGGVSVLNVAKEYGNKDIIKLIEHAQGFSAMKRYIGGQKDTQPKPRKIVMLKNNLCQNLRSNFGLEQLRGMAQAIGLAYENRSKEDLCADLSAHFLSFEKTGKTLPYIMS